MATQTFTLEGQSYMVPHGTSMDELDEYIKGQKKGSDALTQQTQATAKAAGAPSAQYPANIHNNAGETVEHPGAAPIPGTAAIEEQGQRLDLLGRRENRAMRSPTPFSNAVSVYAPVQAAEQVAASKVGSYAGAKVAPHVGLTPEQGELAGGVLGSLGVGAIHGASAVKGRVEMPEKLNLPMGAKFRFKTPNPYEEMGASAQYRDVARNAMKPPKAGYPFPGAQSSAPGATTGPPMPFTPPEGGPPVTATGPIPKMMPPRGYPGVESGSPTSGTPGVASAESRPTGTEEFLTNLVKKPIWTPEDSVDVRNAFGRDGLMRPGEGQTQYRARLMGMIRSSRAAQGMTDIESYPAPKRPR